MIHLPLAKFNVNNEKNNSHPQRNTSNCYVGNSEEAVFAAHEVGSRQNHMLPCKTVHSV